MYYIRRIITIVRKTVTLLFAALFLSFCIGNIADLYIHRSKEILGDYRLSPVDIDGTWSYHIDPPGEGEAAKQVGVDGPYIYWSTYSTTHYKIDTMSNHQVRIKKIPDEVEMIPVIDFYNMLD